MSRSSRDGRIEVEIGGDRFRLPAHGARAMTGRVILTAAEMRAAEEAAIAAGTPVEELMERAGKAAAEAIWRFAGPLPALVLCGPGNNGGDGYVIARELAARGVAVRVAALAEPKSEAARAARAVWDGPVEALADAAPAPLLIDALFGTGLARPLDEARVAAPAATLAGAARVRVAIDLPSGVATDDGAILSPVPDYDLTITFQTLKPSHLLQPAARHMGRIVVADIGIAAASRLQRDRPARRSPRPARTTTNIRAGWSPSSPARCPARARSPPPRRCAPARAVVRLQARAFVAGVPAAVDPGAGRSARPARRRADRRAR